jgi:hypothetical protein
MRESSLFINPNTLIALVIASVSYVSSTRSLKGGIDTRKLGQLSLWQFDTVATCLLDKAADLRKRANARVVSVVKIDIDFTRILASVVESRTILVSRNFNQRSAFFSAIWSTKGDVSQHSGSCEDGLVPHTYWSLQ